MTTPAERQAAAERKRRQRERERFAADPLRVFLQGVVDAAEKAVADGTAPPWLLARGSDAIELLDELGEPSRDVSPVSMALIQQAQGATSDAERQRVADWHEHEFRGWLASRRGTRRRATQPTSASLRMAETTVAWAHKARLSGDTRSAALLQGIRAAKRLVKARAAAGTPEDHEQFTNLVTFRAMQTITGMTDQPPYSELDLS